MKLVLLTTILLTASSCQTVDDLLTEERGHAAMAYQHLQPRKGFEGYLTNRVCLKRHKTKGCLKESIQKHNINDKQTRVNLNAFGIACQINGKRFRVDIERPGFVRIDPKCVKRERWWGNDCKKWDMNEEFIPIEKYDYLIKSAIYCTQGL